MYTLFEKISTLNVCNFVHFLKMYTLNAHNCVHTMKKKCVRSIYRIMYILFKKKCLHWMYKLMSILWKIVLNFNKLYTILYIPTNCGIMALNLGIGWVPPWQQGFVWFLWVFGRREGEDEKLVKSRYFLPWLVTILSWRK